MLRLQKVPFSHIGIRHVTSSAKTAASIITKQQLQTMLKNKDKKFQLLDVREVKEFAAGTIGHAKNVPLKTIESSVGKLDKSMETVVFCQAGVRSAAAQDILQKAGFKNVKNYKGSYGEWSQK